MPLSRAQIAARYRRRHPKKTRIDNKNRRKRADNRDLIYWKRLWGWVYSRCNYPSNQSWANYGGKGIKCLVTYLDIARIWFRDKAWMLKNPHLDRIRSDGHYEIGNIQFLEGRDNVLRMWEERRKRGEREPGEEG